MLKNEKKLFKSWIEWLIVGRKKQFDGSNDSDN